MNALFVAYKPPFITSNALLGKLKRQFNAKKAGFSGTLDPFACGTLIIAFGAYTKLFRFLRKTPKRYRATLWLGASSPSLDIERITAIETPPRFTLQQITQTLQHFVGEIRYQPPIFSAKRIGGKRAYELARSNESIELPTITSTIYALELLEYNPPFLSFEALVSEGTYIRSLGAMIAERLGTIGTLSYLERVSEGAFYYQELKPLDPIDYLLSKPNYTKLPATAIYNGKKLSLDDLTFKADGLYHLLFDNFFAIIEIEGGRVHYRLNRIPRS